MLSGAKLWEASPERKAKSHMMRFTAYVEARRAKRFENFSALHRWSIEDPSGFWEDIAGYGKEIKWQKKAPLSFTPPPKGKMRGGAFFPGAHLNFAENLLAGLGASLEREVLVGLAEAGSLKAESGEPLKRRTFTAEKLLSAVEAIAASLKAAGVRKGDRVAGVLINGPEAVIAMLATASLGAIWSSCSPDFGVSGVVDRLSQVEPKIIFFTLGYFYGGKAFDGVTTIAGCLARLPHVQKAVLVDHSGAFASSEGTQKFLRPGFATNLTVTWDDFFASGEALATPLEFESLAFDDPLYIMFSSGTTGVPKCITHGIGGTLLQHKKELQLHSDLDDESTLLFYTTCGWMMWNWMVSGLAVGARLVLYDGSPAYPDIQALWRTVADEKVTHFGTSPKFIGTCMASFPAGASIESLLNEAGFKADFTALKTILSTGSPLLPEQFEWIYQRVKSDLHLASISGGTDIISCFMLGVPTLPVYAGEIQHAGLGMAVEAWNDHGQNVREVKAELVCTKPFPAMPIGFWNDLEGRKYTKAYFSHFPGRSEVWWHGDFIEITKTGGVIVYGRSDATLNPGGVRIGTAELYRQVETLPEIIDSVAVGRQHDGDVQIILFIKLRPKQKLTPDLVSKIKSTIRTNLTPRHVPHDIVSVSDIPYTRSGKKVELAVTQAIHGERIANLAAIANPAVMAEFSSYGRGEDEDDEE